MAILPTSINPMRGFVDKMLALEEQGEALSLSLIHGFMAGDSPDLGAKMIVITDDQKPKGDVLARELGLEVFSFRGRARPEYMPPQKAIDLAKNETEGPLVIADVWDNPGGGVAGDSTILLQQIMDAGLKDVALGTFWDPMAVRLCHAAGEGSKLQLRFGGKTSAHAGDPIDAYVEVVRIRKNATQSFGASVVPLGNSATIRFDGIEIVLNSNRSQAFSPDLFSNMGIDPTAKKILIVKSTNHFHGAFADIAHKIIYTAVDGPYPNRPEKNNYQHLIRSIWPIVENPHENEEA